MRVTLEVPGRLRSGDRSLSTVSCGSEPVFAVTTFISETSLRTDNALVMPKYQGQLEMNWLHKRAGVAPGKRTEAEAEGKNFLFSW